MAYYRIPTCTTCNNIKKGNGQDGQNPADLTEFSRRTGKAIKTISVVNDKVTVLFENNTYITADKNVVDPNFCIELTGQFEQEVKARLALIEDKLKDTVEVTNLNGDVSFVAFRP